MEYVQEFHGFPLERENSVGNCLFCKISHICGKLGTLAISGDYGGGSEACAVRQPGHVNLMEPGLAEQHFCTKVIF